MSSLGQCSTAILSAAAQEHRVNDAAGQTTILRMHLFNQAKCFSHLSNLEMKLHKDGEGDVRRLHTGLEHVFEDRQALCNLVTFCAAVDEAVVHDLITLQASGLELLAQGQGLVHLSGVTVALDQSAEGNEVRFQAHVHHVLKEVGCSLQVTATDADVHERVESDEVARNALDAHLLVKIPGALQVSDFCKTLDECRVEYCVLVHALQSHFLENRHGLVQAATLYARIQDAAASHRIYTQAAASHLVPYSEHGINIPSPTISLHHGAKGYSRRRHAVLAHLGQSLLQLCHVLHLSKHVQQGVEDNLVDILLLLVNEAIDQGNSTSHPSLVTG
mmetsp:Transcript_32407/g.58925  ORF Transcript_32407/g.58925 Transcript_32407/m.58925 type:complete len:332 (+) Transcript_32407:1430-2425(+)